MIQSGRLAFILIIFKPAQEFNNLKRGQPAYKDKNLN